MKKNTLRKLTLSAVTLGVAALSLTSTTYAWFTTNGKADATGISGTVSSPELLMLIKSPTGWKNTDGTTKPVYDGKVTWDDADTSASTFSSTESGTAATFQTSTKLVNENGNGGNRDKLSPVSIASSKLTNSTKNIETVSFKKLDGQNHSEGTNAASAENYLHYQVVISVSGLEAGKTYDVNMVLPKINDTAIEQYLLVDAGDGVKAGSTIKVSLADALSLGIKNTIISGTGSDINTICGVTTGGTCTQITKDYGGFYHAVEEKQQVIIKGTLDSTGTGDAITYYKNVYGLIESFVKPTECSTGDTNNKGYEDLYTKVSTDDTDGYKSYFSKWDSDHAKTIYSVTGTKDGSFVCVTDLYFFIDGWDYQCFNAIGGQSVFSENGDKSITFTCKEHTN